MYLLAIETTGAFASVAIARSADAGAKAQVIDHINGSDRFSHLQNLVPQVQQLLDRNELSLGDMAGIAVSVGPGSFTGIRIGVSTARALSQITDIPCVAVSSLEGLALRGAKALAETAGDEAAKVLILPMLDARRSQVYAAGYVANGDEITKVIEAAPYKVEELMPLAAEYESVFVMGDGADAYEGKIGELRQAGLVIAPEAIRYQHAGTVAKIGLAKLAAGETCEYGQLQPEYMRQPEAERNLKAKQAKEK